MPERPGIVFKSLAFTLTLVGQSRCVLGSPNICGHKNAKQCSSAGCFSLFCLSVKSYELVDFLLNLLTLFILFLLANLAAFTPLPLINIAH